MLTLNYNILILAVLSLLGVCVGQIVQNGQCDPNIVLVANFEIDRFLGTWHEHQRSASPEQNTDCARFELTSSANAINVYQYGVNDNFKEDATGTATITSGTAQLTLDISTFNKHVRASSSDRMLNINGEAMDFWVLLTDYDNFAVTYSCENISPTQRSLYIWVLGRSSTTLTPLMISFIDFNLNNLVGVTLADLTTIDHSDAACYELPVIQPGQSIILPGQCDANIPVQQNFNVASFTGTWHQIASYYTESSIGTCVRAQYSVGDGVVDVLNSQVVNQALLTISGTATVSSSDNSARLKVILNLGSGQTVEQDLWIISTDYTNYAISYSCDNLANNQKRIYSWILSRERQLSPTIQPVVGQVVQSVIELNNQYYLQTDQSADACFYFPEPSDQPVEFRGQCSDLNVEAMANFEPDRYTGLWHNIELYPADFQDGTCSNAFYELNGGVVDVLNTQVKSETLDTITGTAVVTSTDGSAQLLVTFPIVGTELTISTNYWVLGTDYTSYALVYSCSNINNDYMRVSSWKLSRTKQLTAAANTAINALMANIPVLDQRYYKTEDQSASGCFYYPTSQPGVPVVFPGQCDTTIGMTNFVFSQFQGDWYEVQAYPKEEQSGQCIRHQYTLAANNQLNLVSSSIVDQFLSETNGVVTSADGSGRLTITITSADGQTIPIPFWIVNTDYTSYALAYACVNRGNDFRAIWSWKLSRTLTLTTAAVTAINNAMANIDVLDDRYYENIDQTEQACFYLPEIPRGEPIIIPGQCDATVAPIQNFNTAQFVGRWRLIKSYQSDFQIGTCNEVTYIQVNDRTLTANHERVVSQSLNTVSATITSTDGSGRIQFSLPGSTQTTEYLILGTDYVSYALIYGCETITSATGSTRRVWSWILSRDNTLSTAATANINQIINGNVVLNNRYYYDEDRSQTGCFYYPEAGTGPVSFRGQCDMDIPVVQNFNTEAYMGLWHDVQSYPSTFQSGTCNNARYTLVNGAIQVFNSQVIDQSLRSTSGTAVVANDNSGKLEITINDATTKFWILATDYTSYSYAYSCKAIDDEYVQVSSWKLSRTKTLTAAANTAINNVMNSIPVLDQRYYITRDQTATGCFYFPEPQLDAPVVFPGQCDNNIATMQNFDFSQFQGTWYEIEAYPKDEQTGQCVNHAYSLASATQLNLVSSSVTDQIRTLTNGVVTGTNGRLTITITSEGQLIDIPFWIINTDYTDYALAYACADRDDYRGVWSWKLSRTKQLSAAANTAINNAMANIDVIDNRYFQPIDQSEQACFYLPEIPAGQPVTFPGQCDTSIRGVDNFSASRYVGRWRMIQSYGTESQIGTCNVARYTLLDALTLSVVNSEVSAQALRTISGTAVASIDGTGSLQVTLPSSNTPTELIVLGTDYDSYALLYACENVGTEERRVWSWKMSRDNTLSQAANNNINQIINSIDVLNERYYYTVDRSDAACFYYPEVDSSSSVAFRGQCDMDIPVVQNFNVNAYLGLWHDIQSYPSTFQSGTCNNARYTLANGVIQVVNSQVIDQSLRSTSGTAAVASIDNSGKLEITINAATTKFWILATDYTSYSYAYSCRAIDDEYVQVSSWKLSRTKTLTAAANTAINNVMNSIPVLDQRYYITRDQTATGCFYFPEPQLDAPVVFPGQCDNNIATMQNFDFSQFQGTWYEIEAYPKDEQTGQCVNHAYSLASATQLNLVSSSVTDQIRTLTNGVVTGTNGRLTITITSEGQLIDIPFWIINTDYTDYALAYACADRDDYRGVWSWKLSRTKQLSAAANTAINNAMANIDVIDNRYFQPIDQSEQACFYLPEIPAGQPVTFPGQCDTSIRGVDNFSASRYVGRWRMIQSYGTESQIGTCNVARYTLLDALTLSVVNSEVSAQALRTISGTAVASIDGTGSLQVTLPSSNTPTELIVLGTDYDTYALLYACENVGTEERRVWSWKMSRDNTLSQAANNNINQIINSIDVLNEHYYYTVDRSDAACFYYPEVDSSSSVAFRGQCDMDIPVVQNFNVNAYLGLWHDIQSYPSTFQSGTCNNARYTLTNGVIQVVNSQVIDQSLRSTSGTAVIASIDNSGKLEITINAATTKFWILATDYTSYSYAYSCRAIDDEYVQVSSWKLSRTKTLTAAANTAINNVMNSIPVLDQRYYITRDQTATGCFYFPEPQLDVPVVFPGQCDNNIATLQNFDFSQFQGTWYEIEAYPKDEQTGQCVNHAYSLASATQLNLVSSSVTDQIRTLTNGVVTGTNGRLTITITSEGQLIDIPFWIINTDYTDYALAYACADRDDYRGVWSWKLSRTKQLSAAANTAINNAMANIDVIDNRYFQPIDQSEQACFYLPEIPAGQPVTFPGQCDTSIRGVDNFSASRYAGRWRMIQSYGTESQIGTCNVARYTLLDALTLTVVNSEVSAQALRTISGTAVASNDGTGSLQVTLPSSNTPTELIVLGTDYDSYALLYACENVGTEERRVWSWKMSRDNTLSQAANNNINQIVNSINVLNERYYYNVDRSDAACFYFPDADSNTDVEFRGQCDQNIPVVQNFDAARYMGLWHDIESYPMAFQFGTCPNAAYDLVGSTVNVVNTQVINQTLDTIDGTAVLSTNDGSAKLTVTFNVLGTLVSTDYWVLATDYDNYALVYSCRNIDDEFMSVYSWKLSRTRALSTTSNNLINVVMNTLNILDQRYYVARDQSDASCFYYPDPQPDVPVVFPGQCDNNIPAVANFNSQQFVGLWHETASYPYGETGQCVNHQFTTSTSSLYTLGSSSVVNETLYSSNSAVSLATTDGSGKLTISIVVNGQTRTVPFWVLATDYTDYAIAYGCVNIDQYHRQIYSWKLSRTQQPTAASTTAINNAISSIDVLEDRYYETKQQTDEACFYLPELSPTDSVVFPGQCDENIQAVSNFDMSRYFGRWRLIQTYYTRYQGGTCNEANYGPGSDGSMTVVNSNVVNQELRSISGSAVLASDDGSGKLIVTYSSRPRSADIWVIGTDYDSYALLYKCDNLANNQRRVWSWKLSRTNTLTPAANSAINEIVDRINVLNDRYYLTVDRSDAACFYYPTPTDTNEPVIFRGQCDLTIPAVPNFNPTRYMGTWYDVASYPAPFQTGTCPKAEYSLTSAGTVHVENTQVTNQLLETWIGSASVASDDGTAKLDVTFNVNGVDVTTKYWVLATDYDSYALVYSCQNINDETRAVFSWKLSRTPALTAAANTAITTVVNSVQVLDEQYFVTRNNAEDDCFYYPDNNGGDVLLPGQCLDDSAVPAVTNFDPSLFAGTWHEVSRFPSDLQRGECVSTDYVFTGSNEFTVTHSSIYEERQWNTISQATVSTDGRGVISATIDGVQLNNIYILGTDYNEYALAYSCRNVDANTKQIYSWQLSNSRSGLSTSAQAAISELVSNNIDLWEGYYKPTSQDNDACFHYPVYDQLPSYIELPGPCPTNIRGVDNFDASAYLGRWFEIARYPMQDQSGQCARAEYSLADRVVVYNTEVIDQTLLVQTGFADVASTDGSGQLNVEFVVNGVLLTANYYILATDYTNYALVYSCANTQTGNSRVSSWKLSRTPTMSSQAAAALVPVIIQTQGLIEEYYRPTSQSEEDCFYVPEVNVNEATIFRGQCESITGIQGFDAQRYLGWWHEIERYSIDGAAGECRSSQYTQEGTTYRVVDTQVENNEGSVLTGTVTITNDGRLRRTIPGRPVQDIWVLATDYESYALLYSCENINNEYRAVWSAKHSKSRSLTAAAQAAMAPLIEGNSVLYSQFYQTVDQSDATCFHYPTLTTEQVIIPGQCDSSIPVVHNFEIDEFAGTWYQTERYDAVGGSSCVGNRYTVDAQTGSITVLNFEVRDGILETVEGSASLSADGSANIDITLPVAGSEDATTTASVSILATDYNSYAVAYSCVNVNEYQRQVRAWKLSRERTLSSAGTTAINALIQQRPELYQPYFKSIEQNEDCEEPSSALIVKSSIIMLIVCAIIQRVL